MSDALVPAEEEPHWLQHLYVPSVETAKPIKLSKRLNTSLSAVIDGDEYGSGSIEVVVTIESADINVREMVAFFALADRVYGRVVTGDLATYSRRVGDQLRIDEVRQGSIEVAFRELLSQVDAQQALILTGLILKFLPAIIRAPAQAYRDYQEGQLVRERRRRLRQHIADDQQLARIDRRTQNELVRVLDALLSRERHLLPAARRFALKSVRRVLLRRAIRR